MSKLVNILLLGVVGILGGLFAVMIWAIGFIYLLVNEIPGAKNFRTKLHKLNIIVKEEFVEIFGIFKKMSKVR